MRIGELAEAAGTTTKTLRFYEDQGLLPPAERTPGGIQRRPPTLGEHTDQVLTDLGYGADEIAALRAERIV